MKFSSVRLMGSAAMLFRLVPLLSLAMITGSCAGEELGNGYSRQGDHIFFKSKRIDSAGAHDIDELAVIVGHKLTQCSNVDAASFRVFSQDYTGDKNKVYYKWISGPRFWVVELADADPATFKVLSLGLAKDKNHVWKDDSKVEGADAGSAKAIEAGRVWLDANHVWFNSNAIEGADPKTFEAIGDGYHYRDAKKVYWIFNVVKIVEGADPKTFKPKAKEGR